MLLLMGIKVFIEVCSNGEKMYTNTAHLSWKQCNGNISKDDNSSCDVSDNLKIPFSY